MSFHYTHRCDQLFLLPYTTIASYTVFFVVYTNKRVSAVQLASQYPKFFNNCQWVALDYPFGRLIISALQRLLFQLLEFNISAALAYREILSNFSCLKQQIWQSYPNQMMGRIGSLELMILPVSPKYEPILIVLPSCLRTAQCSFRARLEEATWF